MDSIIHGNYFCLSHNFNLYLALSQQMVDFDEK